VHSPAGPFRRYWFPATRGDGVGVTACSLAEAEALALGALPRLPAGAQLTGDFVEDVDVHSLDARRVVPHRGAPTVHGVWYPCRAQ
jgi:hypothetical protein